MDMIGINSIILFEENKRMCCVQPGFKKKKEIYGTPSVSRPDESGKKKKNNFLIFEILMRKDWTHGVSAACRFTLFGWVREKLD